MKWDYLRNTIIIKRNLKNLISFEEVNWCKSKSESVALKIELKLEKKGKKRYKTLICKK